MANYGTLTDNGNTSLVRIQGPFVFKATGTWGGGSFVVKMLGSDGSTYDTLFTENTLDSDANAQVLFDIPENTFLTVMATLSGATSPSLRWQFIGNILP